MSDMKIILDLLKELKIDQKEHGKVTQSQAEDLVRLNMSLKNVEADTKETRDDISDIKEDVSYHIHRTDILEKLHKDNQTRIGSLEETAEVRNLRLQKLEEPMKAKAWLKRKYLAITGIIIVALSIIATIAKLLKFI